MQIASLEQQTVLEELEEKMERHAKYRGMEKSKRWQAHFLYVYAEVLLRQAQLYELNRAIGVARLNKLPDLDPKRHQGWQLAPTDKIDAADKLADRFVAKGQRGFKMLDQIVKEHPDTPWALLSSGQRRIRLGLTWEPWNK